MTEIEKIDLEKVDWRSSREFFESLAEELEKLDDKDESYDFTWVGKRKSIIEAGRPINKTLRPDVEASKDFDNTKNMLIVGDNLDALKLLQESYLGKIKMIYIDPPYNTGHDFVYHDNFTTKKEDYLDNSTDEDGNRVVAEDEFTENSKANGRFHSDWLSMMYPRLKVARNLLSDDGAVFVSIGNDELDNAIKVGMEVFGEENYLGALTRISKRGSSMGKFFSPSNDFILCFCKSSYENRGFSFPQTEEYKEQFRFIDESGRYKTSGLYQSSLDPLRGCINQRYYIQCPDGELVIPPGDIFPQNEEDAAKITPKTKNDKIWRWSQESYLKNKDNLIFNKTHVSPLITSKHTPAHWNVYTKQYLSNEEDSRVVPGTIIDDFLNSDASKELKVLRIDFSFPKPSSLIKYLMKIARISNSGIVLDFFAGSGTTGHAVMNLNAEDGGNRRYICVQLDEKTDDKSEAKKAGYGTIDQITAERLRRAGDKIKQEHPEAKIDTGFRVFRVDSANEDEDVRRPLGEIEQASLMDTVDNIKKDRSPLDLLFGAVYALALPFDLKLETRKFGDNTVYLYGYLGEGSGLAACFDENISEETVKAIAALKPLTAVFRDSSFPDSSAKINLSEHFRMLAVDTRVKVI